MPNDFAALKSRIAGELNRSDMNSQIAGSILRAIERYADQRFWFNEGRGTQVTSAGNSYVDIPAGLREMDGPDGRDGRGLLIAVGAAPYVLSPEDPSWIEYMLQANPGQGQPVSFARVGSQFRVYPLPDNAYALTATGIYDVSPAYDGTDDTVINAWSDSAQDLTTAQVKLFIDRDILRDSEAAGADVAQLNEALAALRLQNAKRLSRGRNLPSF